MKHSLKVLFWIFLTLLLVIIATSLVYIAVIPETIRRQNYFLYKPRVETSYFMTKFKCKTDDSSFSYFFEKETYNDHYIFNIKYKSENVDNLDYFGEKDVLKLAEKYGGNVNCETISGKDVTQFTSIPAPEPF